MTTILYPKLGTKIDAFDRDKDTTILIKTPSDYIEEFYSYSKNFYKVANWLAEYLIYKSNDISELDTYIFPLTFLYRHSLELLLKSIALKSVENKSKYLKDTRHNLSLILKTIGEKDSIWSKSDEYKWIESFFESLTVIDKESDSFRYPFHIKRDKDLIGKRYNIKLIFSEQTHIDLFKLANKFEIAYDIIESYKTHTPLSETDFKQFTPIFIEEGGDYYAQSVVGYRYSRESFYPYTHSYLKVASELRKHINQQLNLGKCAKRDSFFIPMCYLYRNGIELSLKGILFEESEENFQVRCGILNKNKHKIKPLWAIVRRYVEKYNFGDETSYLDIIDNYINQLNSLDSDSSKFRYPINKNLHLYFQRNTRFDINVIGDFMESLSNALDGIDAQLNYINECNAEMYAEYLNNIDYE